SCLDAEVMNNDMNSIRNLKLPGNNFRTTHTVSYTHIVKKVTKTIGGYTFSAWDVSFKWSSGSTDSAEYKVVFSEKLAIPFYLKVGASSGQDNNYYEYELKDLTLG
ncbi:MAG: hypothetical protein QXT63_04795, partial [Thermoplasmata archaeon]